MKFRQLGQTNVQLSEVGFGCWEIGGGEFWESTDERAMEALRTAVKNGITFFDTALDYGSGHSEQLVGKLAQEFPNIIIATKVPPKDQHWPATDDNVQNAFPKDHILEYAMKSYKNIGRTIDLLQLHVWRDEWVDESCWQEAFDELKKQGIIKHVGVSINDHSPESALKVVQSGKIDSVQVIYNIFDQSPEDKLLEECLKHKVGVIARVPLDEGSLTGTFTEDKVFNDWRKNYFTPENLKETVKRVEALRWLENPNRTLAQAALQFCLHHPALTAVIPGSVNPEHVKQNAEASNNRLSEEELEKLKSHRWNRNFYPNY